MSNALRYQLATDAFRVRLSEQAEVVYLSSEQSSRVFPASMSVVFDGLRRPSTMTEHAARITQMLGSDPQAPDAASFLGDLIRGGLLVPQDLAIGPAAGDFDEAAPIECIVVPTANRVGVLERCLRGHMTSAARFGRRSLEFVVADDSAEEAAERRCRSMLERVAKEHQFPTRYAGRAQKVRYAQRLSEESGVPIDLVEFALVGELASHIVTSGSNRNSLALDTIGKMILSVDDDTECRVYPTPGSLGAPLRVIPHSPAWQTSFFPDRSAAEGAAAFSDVDLLLGHEGLLGRNLSTLVHEASQPGGQGLDADLICQHIGRSARRGRARVLATNGGVVGDSGMGSIMAHLTDDGPTFAELTRSESAYRSAVKSREVHRLVPTRSVGHDTPFMNTVVGFDNRVLLPPFLPVGRGADNLFGRVLCLGFEDGLVGYVPTAVAHRPHEARMYSDDEPVRVFSRLQVSDLVIALVSMQANGVSASGPTTKLRGMGQHLTLLGELPLAEFEDNIRMVLWRRASTQMKRCAALLKKRDGAPSYWANDIRAALAMLNERVGQDDFIVPSDLRRGQSLHEARSLCQRVVGRYGELLTCWGSLQAGASRLRTAGVRLSEPVVAN